MPQFVSIYLYFTIENENFIIILEAKDSPNRKKVLELVEELNNDKDVPRMIITETKIGDIYKERIDVSFIT